jgi:hypothetical protein
MWQHTSYIVIRGGYRRLNIQYNGNEILSMNPTKKAEVGETWSMHGGEK